MLFNLLKDEYHLYHIINVYVPKLAGEWFVVVQKCLKFIFLYLVTHPLKAHYCYKINIKFILALTTSTIVVVFANI